MTNLQILKRIGVGIALGAVLAEVNIINARNINDYADIQTVDELEAVFIKFQLKLAACILRLHYNLDTGRWEVSEDGFSRLISPRGNDSIDTTGIEQNRISHIHDVASAQQELDAIYATMQQLNVSIVMRDVQKIHLPCLLMKDSRVGQGEEIFLNAVRAVLQPLDLDQRLRAICVISVMVRQFLLSMQFKFVPGSNPISIWSDDTLQVQFLATNSAYPDIANIMIQHFSELFADYETLLNIWQMFVQELGYDIAWWDGGTYDWIIMGRGEDCCRLFDPTGTPLKS